MHPDSTFMGGVGIKKCNDLIGVDFGPKTCTGSAMPSSIRSGSLGIDFGGRAQTPDECIRCIEIH